MGVGWCQRACAVWINVASSKRRGYNIYRKINLAIVGSRTIALTHEQIEAVLDIYKIDFGYGSHPGNRRPNPTIVSGGADGVDLVAWEWARKYFFGTQIELPDYDKYGKRAPLERNTTIVNKSTILIAFWDGKSRGTMDSLTKAILKKKPAVLVKMKQSGFIENQKAQPHRIVSTQTFNWEY